MKYEENKKMELHFFLVKEKIQFLILPIRHEMALPLSNIIEKSLTIIINTVI